MTDDEKVEALKSYLYGVLRPQMDRDEFEVDVVTFGEGAGIRVAEVGYHMQGDRARGDRFISGGASWMRSDVECAKVILAAENYLLDCEQEPQIFDGWVGGKYDPSFMDMAQEAEADLYYAITEKPVENWIYRWPKGTPVPDGVTEWYDADKRAAYEAAQAS